MITIADFIFQTFNNSECLYCDQNLTLNKYRAELHLNKQKSIHDGTMTIQCPCIAYYVFNYDLTDIWGGFGQKNNLNITFDFEICQGFKIKRPCLSIFMGNHYLNTLYFNTTEQLLGTLQNINQLYTKYKKISVLI